jgi:ribonuclease P protein component
VSSLSEVAIFMRDLNNLESRPAKFSKQNRLLKSWEFAKYQKLSKRLYSSNFTLHYTFTQQTHIQSTSIAIDLDNSPEATNSVRLGITVSKKAQKLSVQRNRIKRIIREAFRTIIRLCKPNLALIVVAKSSCANLSSQELKEELLGLLKSSNLLH